MTTLVTGEVLINEGISLESALLHVELQDVSRTDADSLTLSEQTIHLKNERQIPFTLDATGYDPKRRYNVSAHLDFSGKGKVSSGDYITTQSYPVLTYGHPIQVSLHLERVS